MSLGKIKTNIIYHDIGFTSDLMRPERNMIKGLFYM